MSNTNNRRILKVFIGILAVVIIAIVAIGIIGLKMVNGTLPQYDGQIKVENISSKTNIYRDSLGIPYIKANSDLDAAFALGYVHAQERLFQMDLFRRAVQGRLSEILGEKTVPFDKMFRTFGFYRNRFEYLNYVADSTKQVLQAYANGVNAFIDNEDKSFQMEFTLLDYIPEHWKPEESVLIAKLLAYQLNISWWTDITFSSIVQKLGAEKAKMFLPDFPENAPIIVPDYLAKAPKIPTEFLAIHREFREFFGFEGNHIGSNNWVVNGKKSESGKPIIANDPHLTHQIPNQWYVVVINSPTWNVAGVTIPGIPGVVIGKNQNISWVLTNVMADDSDYYLEQFDSTETKYLLDGKWNDLIENFDTIYVKEAEEVVYKTVSTHRGPIISQIHNYNSDENKLPPISMRWTALDKSDELSSFLSINKSKNWEDFQNGVSKFKVPGQNFVYADNEGNIGYRAGVKLPIRSKNNPTFVFDGTNSDNDWKGFVPFEKLPKLFNPKKNYIATANNKTVKNYKYHISNLWEPHSRILRIVELLESKEKHSTNDFNTYQNDIISPYAIELNKYLINALENYSNKTENEKTAFELLKNWNGEMDKFSQTPAIFELFFNKLIPNIFKDELGENIYNEYITLANVPYRKIIELLPNQNNVIFDNVNTEQIENRDSILVKSFAEGIKFLEENYGTEMHKWTWGTLHKIYFKHAFHGQSDLLDKLFDVGPFEIGGSGTTVFNTEYSFKKPFENKLGPSMRFIYDFANPDYFTIVLPNGQSGNFMSENYKDMTLAWLNGNNFKVNTNFEKIDLEKLNNLEFLPKEN